MVSFRCALGLAFGFVSVPGLQFEKHELDFLLRLEEDTTNVSYCLAKQPTLDLSLEHKCCCPCPEPPKWADCKEYDPGPSCSLWGDPHISSFDNVAGEQGPEYLSLASKKGAGHVQYYHTYLKSFDEHQSKIQRRKTKVTTTTAAPSKASNETDRILDPNAYETGDFWLVKSNPVHIQGRFRLAQEFLPDNAAIGAVAIGGPFLGGHIIVIEPLDGDATLDAAPMPGGSFIQRSEAGNLTMKFSAGNKSERIQPHADFEANLTLGVKVNIRRWLRHLDVKILVSEPIPGGVDGECGNMNGNAVDDGSDHIANRMGDVFVDEKAKLFTKNFPLWVNTDNDGFDAVQATGDAHIMGKFIRVVLASHGAQLLSEAKLSGMVPYFTGEKARSSYSDLLDELKDADWVKGFDRGNFWNFGSVLDRIFHSVR